MKVSFENIEQGIANYLDREFLSQYEATSVQKTMIGVVISLFIRNKSHAIREMVMGETGKNLGLTNDDGMIDIDLLRDTVKEQISEEGVKYDNAYIGTVTFHKDDVDVLYDYITSGVNGGMKHDERRTF